MRSALLGTFLVAVSAVATANETSFRIDGVPGDFVTEGQSFFYTPANAGFYWYIDDPFHGVAVDVTTNSGDYDASWFVDFANATKTQLLPGTYTNAVRYRAGENNLPWIGVTSLNGCNQIAGSFDVLLATYAPNGDLVSFWATFRQSCDGGPFVSGEIRINVPEGASVAVPTLSTVVLAGLAALLGLAGWVLARGV